MAEREIVCINKTDGHYNPLEAVSHYGYKEVISGQTIVETRQNMVNWAKLPGNRAYVVKNGLKVYCFVNHRGTTEFLQTDPDRNPRDNLLALKECPLSYRR